MNGLIAILLLFALAGFLDKMLGNRYGIGEEFDKGFATLGRITIPIVGIYCIGISLAREHAGFIASLTEGAWTDPSILMGCLLAPDLGAPQITAAMSNNTALALFSGVVVAGCFGQFVSFQLPVFLSALEGEDREDAIQGFVQGLVTIPLGLLSGGLVLGIPFLQVLLNISIIALLCSGIALAFIRSRRITISILLKIGKIIDISCQLMFALVVFGLFLPNLSIAEPALVPEILIILIRMVIVICGGLVFARLAIRYLKPQIGWAAGKTGVNETTMVGLLLNSINSLAMAPLMKDMDHRGKKLNAAFAVSGAYMLGGQMAFIASMGFSEVFTAYLISKGVAGLSAVALSLFMTREKMRFL